MVGNKAGRRKGRGDVEKMHPLRDKETNKTNSTYVFIGIGMILHTSSHMFVYISHILTMGQRLEQT